MNNANGRKMDQETYKKIWLAVRVKCSRRMDVSQARRSCLEAYRLANGPRPAPTHVAECVDCDEGSALLAEYEREFENKEETMSESETWKCENCGEELPSKRSLGQHRRFCGKKSSRPKHKSARVQETNTKPISDRQQTPGPPLADEPITPLFIINPDVGADEKLMVAMELLKSVQESLGR